MDVDGFPPHVAVALRYDQCKMAALHCGRQRMKVLVWESDGFWVATRRLETTRLAPPVAWGTPGSPLAMSPAAVVALLHATLPWLRRGR